MSHFIDKKTEALNHPEVTQLSTPIDPPLFQQTCPDLQPESASQICLWVPCILEMLTHWIITFSQNN